MNHEAIPSDLQRAPFDLNAFARQSVLAGVQQAIDDPAEMKARIMLAFECGHLTAEEARAMIIKHKLETA